MNTKHILHYTRHALTIILVAYLILTWMYYKDNVAELTSINLLVSFIIIPLALFAAILTIKWQQKKSQNAESAPEETAAPITQDLQPKTHKIHLHSQLLLPEGEQFVDIVENTDDVTVLSPVHVDYDNLPILIKPIGDISEPIDDFELQDIDNHNGTQRLCQLITHLFDLNDSELSDCAAHFTPTNPEDRAQPNAAVSMHPDWQQSYISSTDSASAEDMITPEPASFATLPVYIYVPALANIKDIHQVITARLIDYGFDEAHLSFINLTQETNPSDPLSGLNPQLMALSDNSTPSMAIVIAVDSEINDDWIDEHLSLADANTALLPEEAASLLVLWNDAADALLDIDAKAQYALLEYHHQDSAKGRSADMRLLNLIKDAIAAKLLNQDAKTDNSTAISNSEKQGKSADDEGSDTLSGHSITVLSDINPVKQPFDTAIFMSFVDNILDQGALVNDYQLGHHMHRSDWMRCLIAMSLFADIEVDDQSESDIVCLTMQQDTGYTLWLAEPKTMS